MRFIEFLAEYEAYDQYWIDDETEKTHAAIATMAKALSRHEEVYDDIIERFLQYMKTAQDSNMRQEFVRLRQRFIQGYKNKDWQLAANAAFDAFAANANVTGRTRSDVMFAGYGMNG